MRVLQPGEACDYCKRSPGGAIAKWVDGQYKTVRTTPMLAVAIIHDERGCLPVCAAHLEWRKTMCSFIGGHGKSTCTGELD